MVLTLWILMLGASAGACQHGDPAREGEAEASRGDALREPPDNAYYVRYKKGQVFTDGFQRLLLAEKGTDVTVHRVELLDADGLELVGTLFAGLEREVGSVQVSDGFPPDIPSQGPLKPLEGVKVPEGDVGLELLIGLRVVTEGFGSRSGIRILYSSAGENYYQDFAAAVVICPPDLTDEACIEKFEA